MKITYTFFLCVLHVFPISSKLTCKNMKLFFQDCKEELTVDTVTSFDRRGTGYEEQMDHSHLFYNLIWSVVYCLVRELHLDGRRIMCNYQKAKHQHRKEDWECNKELINCKRIDNQVSLFGLATWSNWFSQNCCGITESKRNKAYIKAEVQRVSEDRVRKKKGQT